MTQGREDRKRKEVLKKLLSGHRPVKLKGGGQEAVLYSVPINKATAQEIIEHCNEGNRDTRSKKTQQFASYMRQGKWLLQGPLLFGDNGKLGDGQHRNLAVIDADEEVWFIVQVVPEADLPNATLYIDIGSIRDLRDYLHTKGVKHAARVAPVLVLERNNLVSGGDPFKTSHAEKPSYYALYQSLGGQETFDRVFGLIPRGFTAKFGVKRNVLDWVAMQLLQVDEGNARTFFEMTKEPSQLKEDDPPYALSQRLEQLLRRKLEKRGNVPEREQYTVLTKAWNKYYAGDPVKASSLTYKSDQDIPQLDGREA